jgi:hypothetical protein
MKLYLMSCHKILPFWIFMNNLSLLSLKTMVHVKFFYLCWNIFVFKLLVNVTIVFFVIAVNIILILSFCYEISKQLEFNLIV